MQTCSDICLCQARRWNADWTRLLRQPSHYAERALYIPFLGLAPQPLCHLVDKVSEDLAPLQCVLGSQAACTLHVPCLRTK